MHTKQDHAWTFQASIRTKIRELPVRVCFSSLWVAELLSGVAEIFGLPSLALSLSTMPAAEMEKGAKRRNEKIARKIINLREKESCVASGSKGE